MRKKLLAFCDSPTAPTGFGKVAREILGLVHLLYDVDITIWGINHEGVKDDRFTIIDSKLEDKPDEIDEDDKLLNRKALNKYIMKNDFDVFWSVQDAFNMGDIAQTLNRKREIESIFYFPVDVAMIPKSWCKIALSFDHPVCYTHFGMEQLARHFSKEELSKVKIAYHGTNTKDFHGIDQSEILAFRKEELNLYGNQFLFMNLNKNQTRKDIPVTMFAFQLFMAWWKDQGYKTPKPKLLLHMHPSTHAGENLAIIRDTFMPDIAEHVIFPEMPARGFPVEDINKFMNAADCLVSSTRGEGWGLTTTEAMCTKTPVIVPRNTVNPEIIGENEQRGKLCVSGSDGKDYWNYRWIDTKSHYSDPPRPVTSPHSLASKMKDVFLDCTNDAGERLPCAKPDTVTSRQVADAFSWARELTWQKIFDETWAGIFDSCLDRKV